MTNIAMACPCSATAVATPPFPMCSTQRAEPPKVASQRKENIAGKNSTSKTNSRTVLPFEIHAMNIPTNGDHAIHQPQ